MAREYIFRLTPEQEEFFDGRWREHQELEMVFEQSDINSLRRCVISGNTIAGREIVKIVNNRETYQLKIGLEENMDLTEYITVTFNGNSLRTESLFGNNTFDNLNKSNIMSRINEIIVNINDNSFMNAISSVSIINNGKTFNKYKKPKNCSWSILKRSVRDSVSDNILTKKTMKKYLNRKINRKNKRLVTEELKVLPPMGIFPGGISFQEANLKYSDNDYFRKSQFGKRKNNSWIDNTLKYLSGL